MTERMTSHSGKEGVRKADASIAHDVILRGASKGRMGRL
jgi:hypothetical protein